MGKPVNDIMIFNWLAYILYFILSESSQVFGRSLCIRTSSDYPLHEINSVGSHVGRLVSRLSSEVTPQFILEMVAENSGHRGITCEQRELDHVGREYHRCVRQVAHQARCVTREQEVCQWLQLWTKTCTQQILSKCLASQATEMLVKLQSRLMMESHLSLRNLCGDQKIDVVYPVKPSRHKETLISTRWLRLG